MDTEYIDLQVPHTFPQDTKLDCQYNLRERDRERDRESNVNIYILSCSFTIMSKDLVGQLSSTIVSNNISIKTGWYMRASI